MEVSGVIYSLLIFATVILAGAYFVTSNNEMYGATPISSIANISSHATYLRGNVSSLGTDIENKSKAVNTGIGALDDLGNFIVGSMQTGYDVATTFISLPNLVLTFVGDVATYFHVPPFLMDIVEIMIVFMVVFLIIALVFKVKP